MSPPPKKIAIVGPESTGKTTLARQLAQALDTSWVEEYAREYLENLDRPYGQQDLAEIARGQLEREAEAAIHANQMLICDTNLLVIQIWSEFKYGSLKPELEKLIDLGVYEFHLLTDIDLPWTYDPFRENPSFEERQQLFDLYEGELIKNNLPYTIIRGNEAERLQNSLEILRKLL